VVSGKVGKECEATFTQKAVCKGRWEMGDGRWEMGDGRWEMGDGRWTNIHLSHFPYNISLSKPL